MGGDLRKQDVECKTNGTGKLVGDDVLDVPLNDMAQIKYGVVVKNGDCFCVR